MFGKEALIENCKPAVSKRWLYALAGAMWSGVGVMLCRLAYGWLSLVSRGYAILLALAGTLLVLAIYFFGFSRLADKNIHRIGNLVGDKACLFAFQEMKSYPLVALMIAMGIALRRYSPIPKPYLAILYFGIGGGLLLASSHYYKRLWRMRGGTKPPRGAIV